MSTLKGFLLCSAVLLGALWLSLCEALGFGENDLPAPIKGKASWYGEGYRGKTMANGQPYNPDALTCATWSFPLGTELIVRHKNYEVRVRVTDRGPNPRLNRLIDLSYAAFKRLANTDTGIIDVQVWAIVPDRNLGRSAPASAAP